MTNNRYLYITHVCPYYCPERILFFRDNRSIIIYKGDL